MRNNSTLEEVREYWDTYTNDIEVCKNPAGTLEFFNELESYRYDKISYLREYIKFKKYQGKKVLEIGCGPGIDAVQFARAGADIWGVDLSSRAIELCRANLIINGFQERAEQFFVGNAEELPFPDESFDSVYSHGVLHHTVNTERAIEEVRRVLKPQGAAVIMLYNRWSWFNFLAILSGTNIEHKDEDAPIIKRYSIRQCKDMFRQFGGKIEIHVDRFPKKTLKHKNLFATLNNKVLVPIFDALPDMLKRPFGWHIMIRAIKA